MIIILKSFLELLAFYLRRSKNYFISNFGFITLLEEMLKLDKTNNDLNLIFPIILIWQTACTSKF